ncbi:MAG: hypothetical protein J0H44_13520 [Alphaproteobacteria bacterium]|nr:hypothetical protein [Alphaproteobacteria bacterium]
MKPDIPPLRRFGVGDRVYVQAQQIWLILVTFVMRSDERRRGRVATITYGEVATDMGKEDRRAGHTLGRPLGIIAEYCVHQNVAPLNSIVVNQDTSLPGVEVVLRNGRTLAREQKAVMEEDWFSIRVPTTGTFKKIWMR